LLVRRTESGFSQSVRRDIPFGASEEAMITNLMRVALMALVLSCGVSGASTPVSAEKPIVVLPDQIE
jgi:hypothetical protein